MRVSNLFTNEKHVCYRKVFISDVECVIIYTDQR